MESSDVPAPAFGPNYHTPADPICHPTATEPVVPEIVSSSDGVVVPIPTSPDDGNVFVWARPTQAPPTTKSPIEQIIIILMITGLQKDG